ncbi:SDR family NAD(P)-dependent oxidoreductase [Advenella sp. RU8]|uniref:SDR family NAD(P)-dependent oxidoreductase n=1 Tax=Advenella sp. RU8 TaxID=3399575 RepID=UPI003AAD820A
MKPYNDYFKGKTIIVTGAASGIGLALVEEVLHAGAKQVVLADFHQENLKKHTSRLQQQYPGNVKGILCDVTQEHHVKALIESAAEWFGGEIDLLINNAGTGLSGYFVQPSQAQEMDKLGFKVQSNEDWENAFALNFYGALYGCRYAIPIMQKQGSGQIVNIISGIAFYPMPYQSMYAATKAALNALTLSLRAEFWDDNIKICSATPGTTATAIWKGAAPENCQTPQQSAQQILAGVAENKRVIYGDDTDAAGSKSCIDVDCQDIPDQYLLNIARQRRLGKIIV